VARRLAALARFGRLYATGRGHALTGRAAVTFCSWYPVMSMEDVDRFVDRVTRANGAISAIYGTVPWYPCS
jgi:hypothetical protein